MHLKMKANHNESAFTLIELMITLLVAAVVLGGIYQLFWAHQHHYIVQDKLVEMQQDIRAAMDIMSRDLRMAGYDPSDSADAGFKEANATSVKFTYDLDGDGNITTAVPNETVTYKLNDDTDGDGISSLGRRNGVGVFQPVADSIQALEFRYLDSNAVAIPCPVPASKLKDIRAVEITILTRTDNRDLQYDSNNSTYTTSSNSTWGPYNDHYRRRLATVTVICRNMGL